jgi:type III restriction enzyme
MQGPMEKFLFSIKYKDGGLTLNKQIILIKDECHQATSNIDEKIADQCIKTLNISATPNLSRGQVPDVEITNDEAVAAHLIKDVVLGDEDDTLEDAIKKFQEIKVDYRNLLGVNPCLIIQISNTDKGSDEWSKTIYPLLQKTDYQSLKWIYIVNQDKDCKTNDEIGKLPVSKWTDYAKLDSSGIDIIIFKMKITEGWDIPRACMLYQIRDTQRKQLDEQVMGRVRRNPRLKDFERLEPKAQQLATTAWVWGILPEDMKKVFEVKRADENGVIDTEISLKTVVLKELTDKEDFDYISYLDGCKQPIVHDSIFVLNQKLQRVDEGLREICYEYSDGDIQKWYKFVENLDGLNKLYNKYVCDYNKSMEIAKDPETGEEMRVSFPLYSRYADNGNYKRIDDWVWKRKDGQKRFSFDSDAEKEWAEFLTGCKDDIKKVVVSKETERSLGDEFEKAKEYRVLWGKNYPFNSGIRYEYYMNGIHSSYPDFIMKDKSGGIHIFEVKSVNKSSALNIDTDEYEDKVRALKECYKYCSKLTGYNFYLPILKDDNWDIIRFVQGNEDTISEDEFVEWIEKEG